MASPPRIYHLHPLEAGPIERWGEAHLDRCRAMGFDHVLIAPPFAPGAGGDIFLTADHDRLHPALGGGPADAALARLAGECRDRGLTLLLDLVVDRVAADGVLAAAEPDWFRPWLAAAAGRFDEAALFQGLGGWWSQRLAMVVAAGVGGFRCDAPQRVPPEVWRQLIAAAGEARFIAWTPGLTPEQVARLAGCGFDNVTSSAAWWDGRAGWLVEEYEARRPIAPLLAFPEEPFGRRLGHGHRRALGIATAVASGLLIPMGFEFADRKPLDRVRGDPADFASRLAAAPVALAADIAEANEQLASQPVLALTGEMRALTTPQAPATALLRRDGDAALLILVNPELDRSAAVDLAALGPRLMDFSVLADQPAALEPGEVRLVAAERGRPVLAASPDIEGPALAIERIAPSVDGGRFPAKRIVGETVTVEADIIADGHGKLAAAVLWRPADVEEWREAPLMLVANDRWRGNFRLERIGPHLFTVEAWRDAYASWRDEVVKKQAAGVPVVLELEEGRRLMATLAKAAPPEVAAELRQLAEADLLSDRTAALAAASGYRPFKHRHEPWLPIEAERTAAGFASWYELFPRSQTTDPKRHGTFRDVIARLPAIRDMGFDVLYFPPIHPIGRTNRKGRNNSLKAGPDDPGSPYAIGGVEGGHDALHPELGTLADFHALRDAAAAHGLELAIDFAIQCSPDHPWIKQHPGWFDWRPDGTLRYAENPPKKYEDIVNVDFWAKDAKPALWEALRDVVQYWVDQGVRAFRVDNPHTKPLPFWQWLIADIRSRDPGVIFLSEAFTRPKVMYRLAKIGFSQSYTYFTWRNTKRELTEYLTELTTTAPKEFFRPHFFVNTPDINPVFLQTSGRPGFLIRAALATTLSGLWGLYSGFELCEAAPLPGKEEYLDSEKYEIKPRNWQAPGNIIAEITRLNRIRRANPALQSHLGVTFYNAFDDAVLYFGKATPTRDNVVLVAINLDPHVPRSFDFEIPLWEWQLPDTGALAVEDLMTDRRFIWRGKQQRYRLDPAALPFAIWRISLET